MAQDRKLPAGFSRLADIDPTILQDMRYFSSYNFTGARVPGYNAPVCILQTRVAKALKRVQSQLRRRNLSLKVLDCYRPKRAVRFFMKWVRQRSVDPRTKKFFPRIPRAELVIRKYLSARSNHSTGRAVDLTIVRLIQRAAPKSWKTPCHLPPLGPSGSVDMGTEYDCLDTLSHTRNAAAGAAVLRWRQILVVAMKREGFSNYRKEWWHFDYRRKASNRRRDFPVE